MDVVWSDTCPFPTTCVARYQSFTEADLSALRQVGYDRAFLSVERRCARVHALARGKALSAPSRARTLSGRRETRSLRILYSALHYLLVPFILACVSVWRGFRNRGYWDHLEQRFGVSKEPPPEGSTVWIHAVSVGEVQAALPLVRAVLDRYPQHTVLITTTTPPAASACCRP